MRRRRRPAGVFRRGSPAVVCPFCGEELLYARRLNRFELIEAFMACGRLRHGWAAELLIRLKRRGHSIARIQATVRLALAAHGAATQTIGGTNEP